MGLVPGSMFNRAYQTHPSVIPQLNHTWQGLSPTLVKWSWDNEVVLHYAVLFTPITHKLIDMTEIEKN